MDITPRIPKGRQIIQAYGDNGFRINDIAYRGSVLVLLDRALPWLAVKPADITLESLGELLEAQEPIELLLIGSGHRMALLPLELRHALRARGIMAEIMDTGAACRTFNVLMAEERRVAAALIAI